MVLIACKTKCLLMKNNLRLIVTSGFLILLVVMFISSCVPIKKIEYLQQEIDKNNAGTSHFQNPHQPVYRIRPGDNLYIRINSVLSKSENFFDDDDYSRSSNYYNDQGIYLNSYQVNDSGYIDFPFVGNVLMKDLTLDEAKTLVQSIVDDYLKETTVILKLAINKVTVLGEVIKPGEFSIWESKLTIFDAISMAGDMTPFAKRNKVALVRETSDGSKITYLDLNNAEILTSEYYYILPNDVVYVPPIKGKNWVGANFPYSLVLAAITTTLLLINYFETN